MPSKSEKQRKFIFAKRNEYGTKSKTPKKFKWIWDDDWLKIEEKLFFKKNIFFENLKEKLYTKLYVNFFKKNKKNN